MKAVLNAILVRCEVSDFNFKNVMKFCEGYCNNKITKRSNSSPHQIPT
jgi:hypothetical protein